MTALCPSCRRSLEAHRITPTPAGRRCPAVLHRGNLRCELPAGHPGGKYSGHVSGEIRFGFTAPSWSGLAEHHPEYTATVGGWEVRCDLPGTETDHRWPCHQSGAGLYPIRIGDDQCGPRCQPRTTYPIAPGGWYTDADIDRLMADLVETEQREIDGQESMFGDME